MSSSCPDVAERLCAWDAAHCDELRSALARREEPDCSTALRGLDAADRLPAHLRPAMMAQVLADLTGQTGEVEALKEGLRGRGVGPDASARKP
jgi:hypothetical protein